MFNKLKFNNLVISNKKGIQQSRIQTINKLVHKIRKLKTLSEKHPDNIKCKERIRKSMETMEIIKKLKRVDIMKKLLLMEKPAAAIITNGMSIPEEMAVALLSMNKVMQNLIKKIKTELEITELENDIWKQGLMESSKRKIKIERTEEKRRKRLELKQQKALGQRRQEWLEQNQPKMETEHLSIEPDTNISTAGGWKIEKLSNNKTAAGDNENIIGPNKILKRRMKEKPVIQGTLIPKKNQTNVKKELSNTAENQNKKLNTITENFEMINSNEKEESLVVDPFFITDSGENYLSTAISKKETFSEEENEGKQSLHIVKLDKFDQKRLVYNENRSKDRQQNKWDSQYSQSKQKTNKHGRNSEFSRSQFSDKNNVQLRQKSSFKKDLTNHTVDNVLHPSWAAKQKVKPIITEFKGKKITFDGDSTTTNTYSGIDIKKKPAAIKSNSEKDSLHPSWAAKQKLKPSITAFQGKKITFDIDD